tara:strand:- start:7645 stop:9129 length:1485 start_codon:yes stop_codon:yes gene_type:complete
MKRGISAVLISLAVLSVAGNAYFYWNRNSVASDPVTVSKEGASASPAFFDAGPFKLRAIIDPEAPRVGKNHVTVILQDEAGKLVTGAALDVVAVMPAMGAMPAMYAPAEMAETGKGRYEGEFEPSMSGEWPLTIKVKAEGTGAGSITFDLATGRKGLSCSTCGGSQTAGSPGTVRVDAERRQLIGVTTRKVKRKRLRYTIRAAGSVVYNETNLYDISLKYGGWVGDMFADYLGKAVTKGRPLFTAYSPELFAAQEEYLESRRRPKNRSANKQLLEAARTRLRLWDFPSEEIKALEKRKKAKEFVPILAPADGVVIDKTIVKGSAFRTGERLLRIADLSTVWVEAQVYDYELPFIKTGMKATIILPELQDRKYKGKVSYIFPFMDGDTRTARVRVELDNSDGFLRPDMYAHIHLKLNLGKRLAVPEEAVLYAGQSRVVFLDLGDGLLQPRKIKTGLRNRRWIEVLDGLEVGDIVVTSGNFLIAAESKLKAGVPQW